MEKLQIYSQCWSRTQHKPWGLWGRQQRPKGSLQHYSASFCGPQHVLHSACATPRTRERAHAPNYHAKPSPVLCTGEHSSACTLILRSGPDKGRERAHTHAPTRWKTQGFMDWWCLSGKNHPTPPSPQELGKQATFPCSSVILRHFGIPLRRSRRRNLLS